MWVSFLISSLDVVDVGRNWQFRCAELERTAVQPNRSLVVISDFAYRFDSLALEMCRNGLVLNWRGSSTFPVVQ